MQEAEPPCFRIHLEIVSDSLLTRRVRVAEAGAQDLDHTTLGNLYLRRLEVDPVLQAVGRVRFLTLPREVVLFQMNDFSLDLGDVEGVRTPRALRNALDAPSPQDVDRLVRAIQAETLMQSGHTAAATARQLGVSRRTVFDRLAAVKSAKSPVMRIYREFLHSLWSERWSE